VRGLVAQGATDQCQGKALGFKAFNGTAIEVVTQQRHERLCARINSQAWSIEHRSTFGEEVITGHQLQQRGLVDLDRQAGVATFERMANPIGFVLIQEDDLIGLRHRLCAARVMHVDSAIGKYEMRRGHAFLGALVPACARTYDIPYRHGVGHQQRAGVEISHVKGELETKPP
jgi:hypothetical protein